MLIASLAGNSDRDRRDEGGRFDDCSWTCEGDLGVDFGSGFESSRVRMSMICDVNDM
jgi:hypothetical protein